MKCDIFHKASKVSAEYVNTWLKIKEEASGWPAGCTTQEQQAQHLHDYERREGIRLDYDQVQHNPGRRALAKMMLNSMWGKFGQRNNKTQVREFTESQSFQEFLDSDQNDIRYVSLLTEDRVEVHYTKQDHCESLFPNLNIFVACFTTCWARLRLYEALELLGEWVLYRFGGVCAPSRSSQSCLGSVLGRVQRRTGGGRYHCRVLLGGAQELRLHHPASQEGFHSIAKERLNSIMRSCAKMSWPNCLLLWLNPAPPASRSLTPFSARQNPIPSIPDPAKKITVWCVPKEWWIRTRPKHFPMATRG